MEAEDDLGVNRNGQYSVTHRTCEAFTWSSERQAAMCERGVSLFRYVPFEQEEHQQLVHVVRELAESERVVVASCEVIVTAEPIVPVAQDVTTGEPLVELDGLRVSVAREEGTVGETTSVIESMEVTASELSDVLPDKGHLHLAYDDVSFRQQVPAILRRGGEVVGALLWRDNLVSKRRSDQARDVNETPIGRSGIGVLSFIRSVCVLATSIVEYQRHCTMSSLYFPFAFR